MSKRIDQHGTIVVIFSSSLKGATVINGNTNMDTILKSHDQHGNTVAISSLSLEGTTVVNGDTNMDIMSNIHYQHGTTVTISSLSLEVATIINGDNYSLPSIGATVKNCNTNISLTQDMVSLTTYLSDDQLSQYDSTCSDFLTAYQKILMIFQIMSLRR